MAKADVVCCNLMRRQFQRWRKDNVIRSINVYSDASPVTGAELQGMVIDVNFKDGRMERIILPGSTLAYGHCSSLDKGIALIWAIWLVAGPSEDDVRWFCSMVRSLTTDFGNEMHLLEVPDVVSALVLWIDGVPLHRLQNRVHHDRRLFTRALRLAGWSHTLGNVMKTIANKFKDWPQHLGSMRKICKVFRNDSYRQHMQRRLRLPAEQKKRLDSFTAGFAKWRYETVPDVLTQICRLRDICALLQPALFAHVQDQEEMSAFFKAIMDGSFWRWAQTTNRKLFRVLEDLRRWGMVCDCEQHIEDRRNGKKFIDCPRTSTTHFKLLLFSDQCRFHRIWKGLYDYQTQ